MSNLTYLASKCAKGRKMTKKSVPERGQNHKIAGNSATMLISILKISKNIKTNWYKHVIIFSSTLSMSNLNYLASKCAKGRKMTKKCP